MVLFSSISEVTLTSENMYIPKPEGGDGNVFLLNKIEWMLGILFVYLLVTQVLMPLWNDLPLFPILRPRRNKLKRDISEAKEEVDLHRQEEELERVRKGLQAEETPIATPPPPPAEPPRD